MKAIYTSAAAIAALLLAPAAGASWITFEAAGGSSAAISPARDAFRAAVGGGSVAGANGSFAGLRREINWDGVPDARADPNPCPAISSTSIRRVERFSARREAVSW